jgi:hypothetical protein
MHRLLKVVMVLSVLVLLSGLLLFIVSKKVTKSPIKSTSNSKVTDAAEGSAFGKLNKTTQANLNLPWNKQTIGDLVIEYPNDWPVVGPESIVKTSFGVASEIQNNDGTLRLIIYSGINSGYDIQKITEYNQSLIAKGWKSFSAGENNGVRSPVTKDSSNEKRRIIASYINSPDKTSQYSVLLESTGSASDEEMNDIFNTVIGTASFLTN